MPWPPLHHDVSRNPAQRFSQNTPTPTPGRPVSITLGVRRAHRLPHSPGHIWLLAHLQQDSRPAGSAAPWPSRSAGSNFRPPPRPAPLRAARRPVRSELSPVAPSLRNAAAAAPAPLPVVPPDRLLCRLTSVVSIRPSEQENLACESHPIGAPRGGVRWLSRTPPVRPGPGCVRCWGWGSESGTRGIL